MLWQFRLRRYVPGVYWLAVVLISIVGTLITDNLTDNFVVSLVTTTIVFSVVLGSDVRGLVASEKTLSIHTIVHDRREAFYWLAVLFTFALGTAAGDLTAERLARLLAVGADLRRVDRARCTWRTCGFALNADPRVLDRLHPDAAARRLDRRLPLTGRVPTAGSASARRSRAWSSCSRSSAWSSS